MKKIIAVADTHVRRLEELPRELIELMDVADLVIHAGDFTGYEVYCEMRDKYNLKAVRGNLDDEKVKKELPDELTFTVEGVRFGVTHKGNYVDQFYDLGYKAMEMDVDILIFGHIHRFVIENTSGRVIISPGSPTMPRFSVSSCAEINVENKRIDIELKFIGKIGCCWVSDQRWFR